MLNKEIFRFFKDEDNLWNIDLPEYIQSGGMLADLYMVAGADEFLDYLSKGKKEVDMRLSNKEFQNAERLHFLELGRKEGFEYGTGAWYNLINYNNEYHYTKMWLCDVTKWIFAGEFPGIIYFKVL